MMVKSGLVFFFNILKFYQPLQSSCCLGQKSCLERLNWPSRLAGNSEDRDSVQNWYAINYPTTLQTLNETVTHCCSPMALCAAGFILQAKLPSLDTQPPLGSPSVTILSASSVPMLIHCVVKYSRPPGLNSSQGTSYTSLLTIFLSIPFDNLPWRIAIRPLYQQGTM